MAPPSFRLDTLAATFIERLEPVRRAHLDNPEAARQAIERTLREAAENVAQECRAVVGDEAQARRIEKESVDTFLPRYLRLAVAQNMVERREAITPLNILVQRFLPLFLGLVSARVLSAILPGPWDIVFYMFPLLALFTPEWLGFFSRRRYTNELQELADDLGQVQDADEKLAPSADADDPVAQELAGLDEIKKRHAAHLREKG